MWSQSRNHRRKTKANHDRRMNQGTILMLCPYCAGYLIIQRAKACCPDRPSCGVRRQTVSAGTICSHCCGEDTSPAIGLPTQSVKSAAPSPWDSRNMILVYTASNVMSTAEHAPTSARPAPAW